MMLDNSYPYIDPKIPNCKTSRDDYEILLIELKVF